jgi:2-oxoglutarate dehydrogenase E2 component (dihydrolipoamide succinyltransferase)
MSLEIKVPAVGESITEVILSKWIKTDGDQVEMDEVIAELESDNRGKCWNIKNYC